jgi:hypothetical protein
MKWMIGYVWILSLIGAFFYGHEFGMIEGEKIARKESGYKFNETAFAGFKK